MGELLWQEVSSQKVLEFSLEEKFNSFVLDLKNITVSSSQILQTPVSSSTQRSLWQRGEQLLNLKMVSALNVGKSTPALKHPLASCAPEDCCFSILANAYVAVLHLL